MSCRRRGWLTIIALSRRCFGSWSASVSCRRQPSFRVHKGAANEGSQTGCARRCYCSGLLAAVALASCAVGPDYHPPATAAAGEFRGRRRPKPNAQPLTVMRRYHQWWRALHDRELDSLIDRAIAASPTLEDRLGSAAAGARARVRRHWLGAADVGGERRRRMGHGQRFGPRARSQTLVSAENGTARAKSAISSVSTPPGKSTCSENFGARSRLRNTTSTPPSPRATWC